MNALLDPHTREFRAMAAAKAWGGMLPSVFDALSESDRGRIMAHERIASLYAAHTRKCVDQVGDKNKPQNTAARDPKYDAFSSGR